MSGKTLIRVVHDDYYWSMPGSDKRHSTLPLPPVSMPQVTLNGIEQSVGIKGVDSGCDWYAAIGDVTLIQDERAPRLPKDAHVRVDFDAWYQE